MPATCSKGPVEVDVECVSLAFLLAREPKLAHDSHIFKGTWPLPLLQVLGPLILCAWPL